MALAVWELVATSIKEEGLEASVTTQLQPTMVEVVAVLPLRPMA